MVFKEEVRNVQKKDCAAKADCRPFSPLQKVVTFARVVL